MKMKMLIAIALVAPLVAHSQCRVTYLGPEAKDGSREIPEALDKGGYAMTVSSSGIASIWGADGILKSTAPVGRASNAPFTYSMNDVGQAVISASSCSGSRPTYSTNLAIWNWRTGSIQCLKPLPFEMDPSFLKFALQRTVLDNKGWVYASVEDLGNAYRAVVWKPNRSPLEFQRGDGDGWYHQYILGGNVNGLLVGYTSTAGGALLSKPASWVKGVPSGAVPALPGEYGGVNGAASNGDMVGYSADYDGTFGDGLWWANGGQDWKSLPVNFYPKHVNKQGRVVGIMLSGGGTPTAYSKGKVTELSTLMPSWWADSGKRLVDVHGLNDQSQILASYQVNSTAGTSVGSVLLAGCFGPKP